MEPNIPKKSNLALIITGIVIAIILVGLFTNGFGLFSRGVTGSAVSNREALSIGSSPVLGNENSPLTIYIFSDFSCPACVYASETVVPQMIEDYVSTGKAKMVFKYFPGHGAGKAAHYVGYGLAEQGLFWQFHDLAFKNSQDTGDLVKMKSLAQEVGANMTQLNAFLDSNAAAQLMQQDIQMGRAIRVEGTPAFVIGDQMIFGVQQYSEFQRVINSQLN